MPAYDLSPDRNVMEIHCKLAGKTFELYYRMPTNAERMAYDNAMTKRKGAQIKIAKDWQIIQAKVGRALVTGFRRGDFAVSGKVIASEQSDPDYYADWKNLLFQKRPDLLTHLCRAIFSATSEPADVDLDDDDDVVGTIEDLLDPDKFVLDAETDGEDAAALALATMPTAATPPDAPEAASAGNP